MENNELASHLESLQREECYRVESVLKQSPTEVTQLVYFEGSNGAETGPFIRKYIQRGIGLGSAYERMYDAQRDGMRFKYIPAILECYSRNDRMVVVMECVRGQTLQEAAYQSDTLMQLTSRTFPMLCDAVEELHSEFDPPIIHRDIKPSNIILTSGGLVLIDFGIARAYHEGADADTNHFGTRNFAPPEQYGFGQTTVRSDIYSLGMVLYFCLTESMPTNAIRESGFVDIRIPEPLRQVIVRATALDPAFRYGSARELKQAFLEALQRCGADANAMNADQRADFGDPADSGPRQQVPPSAAQPTDSGAAPLQAAESTELPEPSNRFRVLGEIWNVLLVIFFLYMARGVSYSVMNQTGPAAANPHLFHLVYLFVYFLPGIAITLFTVADKRRLKKKFPRLRRMRWWQWLVVWVAVLLGLIIITLVAGSILGAKSYAYTLTLQTG